MVKRYLHKVIINRDGLLVVLQSEPFLPMTELIVVPQHIIHGLMTSLHLRLNHPTESQLLQVFKRSFFAIKAKSYASLTVQKCDTCQSLKTVPRELHLQSSIDYPITPCKSFAADILRRYRQKIFVIRDSFSSYTHAELISAEDQINLRISLIRSVSILRPSPQTCVIVRTDNAPGFFALKNDLMLKKMNIEIDYGRRHNRNKNPVIDKGIRELISEMLRMNPEGGQVSSMDLSYSVNQLNSRIRGRGLTSWEILFQRDHQHGLRLDIDDNILAKMQTDTRIENQISSARFKSQGGHQAQPANISCGSLVYIKHEGDKTKARDRYIVIKVTNNECFVRKLLKSDIRAKDYKLKLTEVYPVISDLVLSDHYQRGLDYDEDEDEGEELEQDGGSAVKSICNERVIDDYDTVTSNNEISVTGSSEVDNTVAGNNELNTTVNLNVSHPTNSSDTLDAVSHDVQLSQSNENVIVDDSINELEREYNKSCRPTRMRRKPKWLDSYVSK